MPAGILAASAGRAGRAPGLQRVLDLALSWSVIALAMVTVMRTKFHHYILPAVPAICTLVGLYLAESWHAARREPHRVAVEHVFAFGGALLMARVGADLLSPITEGLPGAARLFHLLSYQYRRAWPPELDFRATLSVFVSSCALLCAGLGSARWRRQLIIAQSLVAVLFAAWLGQIYLARLAPSFGQRHVIEAFARDRNRDDEPLIAYQLNWKGENFYTGNHLAIFVSSGKPFQRYLAERRISDPVVHVVLETARLPSLRAELGLVDSFELLTDRRHGDKISLVRARLR